MIVKENSTLHLESGAYTENLQQSTIMKKHYIRKNGNFLEINEAQAAYIEANNERIEREVTNWWAYIQLVFEQ